MANRLRRAYHRDELRIIRRRPGRPPRLPARAAVRAVRADPPRRHRAPPGAPAAPRHRLPPVADRPRRHRGQRGAPRRRFSARLRRAGRRHRRRPRCPRRPRGSPAPAGWRRSFTFYSLEGAAALAAALAKFDGGRVVVNVVDLPIKCPVAPLEFCFLADWYFRERGIRDRRRAHLRDPARRRLHQADRLAAPGRVARGEGRRTSSPSSTPARSTAPAAGSDRLRRPRGCASTSASSSRCTVAPSTSGGPRAGRRAELRDRPTTTPCRPRRPRTSS